ncbi:MAG: aminomethyltransferase family protein [Chloroflexi bacterium]|nr:aminomethyltransferase family protein [Chloroflexota bacterium]
MPIGSPFHSRTDALCRTQEWREWSGYFAAISYQVSHEVEYYSVRNAAGLLDVSPLFKYEITGSDAGQLVDRIMTRNIGKCQVGQVVYSPWCDERGKVIDDGTIARLGETRFRVTAADPNLRWFQDCSSGLDAQVRDVSVEVAALALQGPNARNILKQIFTKIDLDRLPYYHAIEAKLGINRLEISRTGYTGDLGYELWIGADNAEALWDRVMEAGQGFGLQPLGLAALDMLRVEAGLLLIDVDYTSAQHARIPSQYSSPIEIGLGWAVDLAHRDFIGAEALRAEKQRGSLRKFVGLEVSWEALDELFDEVDLPPQVAGRASRMPVPLYAGGKQIGQATSMLFSPILKKYIALATVEAAHSQVGGRVEMEITVEYERKRAEARVAKLPFFDPKRKKALAHG